MSRIILPSYVVDKIEKEDAERAEQAAKENLKRELENFILDLAGLITPLDCEHSREKVKVVCRRLLGDNWRYPAAMRFTKREMGRIIADVLLGPGFDVETKC